MAVVVFVILLGAGLCGLGLWLAVRGLRLRLWPTTTARIVDKRVERDGPNGDDPYFFVARVRYQYQVDGRTLEGDRIFPGHFRAFEPEMKQFVGSLPAELPVHYRKRDPRQAFLLPDTLQWAGLAIACGGVLLFLGLAVRFGG